VTIAIGFLLKPERQIEIRKLAKNTTFAVSAYKDWKDGSKGRKGRKWGNTFLLFLSFLS